MTGSHTWTEQDEVTSAEFMSKAEQLAKDTLAKTTLHIWRGKQPYQDTTIMLDTLIVSEHTVTGGNNLPPSDYLLRVQYSGMGTEIEAAIGKDECSTSTPFGGGHNPIRNVENWLSKLAHLDLSLLGNEFVWQLEAKIHALEVFATVQTFIWELHGETVYRADVVRGLNPGDPLCVTFVINHTGNVAVLTSASLASSNNLNEIARHQFDQTTWNTWMDDVLLLERVLDELTN